MTINVDFASIDNLLLCVQTGPLNRASTLIYCQDYAYRPFPLNTFKACFGVLSLLCRAAAFMCCDTFLDRFSFVSFLQQFLSNTLVLKRFSVARFILGSI